MSENHMLSQRKQNLSNLTDRLVFHCAKNEYKPTIWIESGERGPQRPSARRIMRYIQNDFRLTAFGGQDLKSGGPTSVAHSLLNVLGQDSESDVVQLLRSRNGQGQISQLVPS